MVKNIIETWGTVRWGQMKVNDREHGGTLMLTIESLYYEEPFNIVWIDLYGKYRATPEDRGTHVSCSWRYLYQVRFYMSVRMMTTDQILARYLKRGPYECVTNVLHSLQHGERELTLTKEDDKFVVPSIKLTGTLHKRYLSYLKKYEQQEKEGQDTTADS